MLGLAAFLAIFIGMAVGLLGGGGSILTTPLLVYVMDFDPKQAIAASLFVVAVTSAFGLIHHARAGRVRWKTGLLFGVAGMVGAFAGGQVGAHLPGSVLLAAFAVMMAATAIAMIRGRKEVEGKSHGGRPIFRILIDGFVVGVVTGLVGAGGGFLVVPALVLLGGLPMPIAVGTSLLVVMMKSSAGFLGYALTFGGEQFVAFNPETEFDWNVVLVITGTAVVGSILGALLSGRIHPDRLRKGFGWFVLVMAVFILAQEIGGSILEFARGSTIQAIETIAGMVIFIVGIVLLIRWPAKVPVGDFDTSGADGGEVEDRGTRNADSSVP
ncbi:MAG: sulfite exporter TauE/SafE family protein [Actinomycetota bacterium]|nr:sulfite exporter TauE/SafE family protein [Actinomycetota bacterium]